MRSDKVERGNARPASAAAFLARPRSLLISLDRKPPCQARSAGGVLPVPASAPGAGLLTSLLQHFPVLDRRPGQQRAESERERGGPRVEDAGEELRC